MTIAAPAVSAEALPFTSFDSRSIAEAPLNGWHPTSVPAEEALPAAPWLGRLVIDPAVSETSPVVIGTYITTRHVASLVVDGWSWAEIRTAHPDLTDDDIRACLAYAIEEESPLLD